MSKKKKSDQRRKAALAERTKVDAFKFQVEWQLKKVMPSVSIDNEELQKEMREITSLDIFKALDDLQKFINGVKAELNISPVDAKCTLNGSIIAYLYGITSVNPLKENGSRAVEDSFAKTDLNSKDNLLVDVYYDNDVRMKAFEWAKAHGYETVIMYYRPIIKLKNMRVTLQRVMNNDGED